MRRLMSEGTPEVRGLAVVVGVLLVIVVVMTAGALLTGRTGVATSISPSLAPTGIGVGSASPAPSNPTPSPPLGPSSQPSATSAATPTLTPSPPPNQRPVLAVVLVDGLRVRSDPGLNGKVLGTLGKGDVVDVLDSYVEPVLASPSGWSKVDTGKLVGWVSDSSQTVVYLDLRHPLPVMEPARISGMATGPDGFLAWGYSIQRSDEAARPLILVSSDGVTWQQAVIPPDMPIIDDAAWGPAGWLVVTSTPMERIAGLWQSVDGLQWGQLSDVPDFPDATDPRGQLDGSSQGYVLSFAGGGSRWSADGSTWTAIDLPDPAAEIGVFGPMFVASYPDGAMTTYALSADRGSHWTPLGDLSPSLSTPMLTIADSQLYVVVTDESGSQTVWRRSLVTLGAGWQRAWVAESAFTGNVVTSLASDGTRLVAAGYDRASATPRLWQSPDGSTWTDVSGDGLLLHGDPDVLAGGSHGFAALGHVVTAAGVNPVMWHSSEGLRWRAESTPAAGVLTSPLIGGCPDVPQAEIDWELIPHAVAAACFGSTQITFRAWLTEGGGCGAYTPGTWSPAWLAHPLAEFALVLAPFATPFRGCGSAVLAPDAHVASPQQWVTVTGHFNDPAASTCRWLPDATLWGYLESPDGLAFSCREKFVVTSVVPAG